MPDLFTRVSRIKTGTKLTFVVVVLGFAVLLSVDNGTRPQLGVTNETSPLPVEPPTKTPTSAASGSPSPGKLPAETGIGVQRHNQRKTTGERGGVHSPASASGQEPVVSSYSRNSDHKPSKPFVLPPTHPAASESDALRATIPQSGGVSELQAPPVVAISPTLPRSPPKAEGIVTDTAASRRNFVTCLTGSYGCNPSLLTPEQTTEVKVAALKRNHYACLNGNYGCNRALLTPEQVTEVNVAALKRNHHACLNGNYGCNRALLTPEQVTEVNVAALKRNYYACLNSNYGCESKLLTLEQAGEVAAAAEKKKKKRIP